MSSSKPVPVLVLREVTIKTWLSGSDEPRRARVDGNARTLLELLGQPRNELESTGALTVQVASRVVRVSLNDGTQIARFSVDTVEAGVTIVFVDNSAWLDSLLAIGAELIDPESWPESWLRAAYMAEA